MNDNYIRFNISLHTKFINLELVPHAESCERAADLLDENTLEKHLDEWKLIFQQINQGRILRIVGTLEGRTWRVAFNMFKAGIVYTKPTTVFFTDEFLLTVELINSAVFFPRASLQNTTKRDAWELFALGQL